MELQQEIRMAAGDIPAADSDAALAIHEDSKPLVEYVSTVRALLLQQLKERKLQVGAAAKASGISDPLIRNTKEIIRRLDHLASLSQGYLIQTRPDCSPTEEDRQQAMNQLHAAVNALLGIELEGRASQERFQALSNLLTYQGMEGIKGRVITLRIDESLNERFKRITSGIREARKRIYGRTDVVSPEDTLNLLIALGEAQVDTLARMGTPDLAAVLGLAGLGIPEPEEA